MGLIEVIIVVFLILWLTGTFAFPAVAGSAVHILLVVILVLIVIRLLQGKSAL